MPPRLSPFERFMLFAIAWPMIDSAIVNTLAMNIHFPFDVSTSLAFWTISIVRALNFCMCLGISVFLPGPGMLDKLEQIEDNTEELLDRVEDESPTEAAI